MAARDVVSATIERRLLFIEGVPGAREAISHRAGDAAFAHLRLHRSNDFEVRRFDLGAGTAAGTRVAATTTGLLLLRKVVLGFLSAGSGGTCGPEHSSVNVHASPERTRPGPSEKSVKRGKDA